MSKLAAMLPTPDQIERERSRPGRSGACDVYGDGDIDDWRAVERIRLTAAWVTAQRTVDATLGIEPVDPDKFRYHWRRKCWHWTTEQRNAPLDAE